jgi:hypothetical protein
MRQPHVMPNIGAMPSAWIGAVLMFALAVANLALALHQNIERQSVHVSFQDVTEARRTTWMHAELFKTAQDIQQFSVT